MLAGGITLQLYMIRTVTVLVSALSLTIWMRVDGWRTPWSWSRGISVVNALDSFGAALGESYPGESSGDHINVEPAELVLLQRGSPVISL